MHKIGQSGRCLCKLVGLLLKTEFSLMKNILKPFAKSMLIPLGGLTAAAATDVVIHKKFFGSSCPRMLVLRLLDLASLTTTLIICNE